MEGTADIKIKIIMSIYDNEKKTYEQAGAQLLSIIEGATDTTKYKNLIIELSKDKDISSETRMQSLALLRNIEAASTGDSTASKKRPRPAAASAASTGDSTASKKRPRPAAASTSMNLALFVNNSNSISLGGYKPTGPKLSGV